MTDSSVSQEAKPVLVLQANYTPTIRSFAELAAMTLPPVRWVVPGILPEGLIALAGKPKIGKSMLDMGIGRDVATGGLALGSIKVTQGDVLYLALEDNERRLQDRMRHLLAGAPVPARFEYATAWKKMSGAGIRALENWIDRKQNPRLIIIDPFVKVRPTAGRSQAGTTGYDADYAALEELHTLANTRNVCILVQFHMRKAGAEDYFDEINATSGIGACADGFLSLKRARGQAGATLRGTGRDYQEDVDLALSFNDGHWSIEGNAEEVLMTQERKEILDAVTRGHTSPRAICDYLGHRLDSAMKMRLSRMVEAGQLYKPKEGVYLPPREVHLVK
jgi:hypothetical protein